jgi:hypothetical protein
MPKFEKPSAALVERFETVMGRVAGPDVTRRPMFADHWWVRLSPERLNEVLASGEGTMFSVMPGREMKGYAVMSKARVADDAGVDAWVREALDYTASMPPKEPKPKAGAKKR